MKKLSEIFLNAADWPCFVGEIIKELPKSIIVVGCWCPTVGDTAKMYAGTPPSKVVKVYIPNDSILYIEQAADNPHGGEENPQGDHNDR